MAKKSARKTAKKSAPKAKPKKATARKAAKKPAAKAKVSFVPAGYYTATPYMTIRNAHDALEFYKKAFGAKVKSRMDGPDGKVMHAEIVIGNSHIMLGEEQPQMGMPSPEGLGGSASGVMLYVPNVDKVFNAAVEAGAKVEMPVGDQFWGDRYGKLIDPFGHRWSIATHIENMTPKEMARRGEEFMKQMAAQNS